MVLDIVREVRAANSLALTSGAKMSKRHSAQSDTVAIVRSPPQQAFPNTSFTVSLHLAQLAFMWRHHEKLFGRVRGAGMASLLEMALASSSADDSVRAGDHLVSYGKRGGNRPGAGRPSGPWEPHQGLLRLVKKEA